MFLVTPIFAAIPHPMTLVAVQAATMASMPFTAWRICGRLGLGTRPAIALALLTLVNPGSCFIAIHEFHPEAFAAPFLLLLIEARLARNLARFWLWFLICVACKENIALLLVVWGGVFSLLDRRCDLRHQWRWNIAPALLAACWVGLYGLWLSPWLNQGRVEYTSLYSHLGNSGSDILTKLFMEPHRAGNALRNGLTKGNLVWGLAVSFAGLPFLRPRWLLIAAPLLLQHVLSSRLWDWSLSYHYAAPLIPLFWIATAEGVAAFRPTEWLAPLPLLASFVLQIFIGPFRQITADFPNLEAILWERDWKARLVARAAEPKLSVTAGFPYLSHLAMRRELYSLHHILKGAGTLSNRHKELSYDPDLVLIDYSDHLTMAHYHAGGQLADSEGVLLDQWLPATDELLNRFLTRQPRVAESVNAFAVYRRGTPPSGLTSQESLLVENTSLERIAIEPSGSSFAVETDWRITGPRSKIPWLTLMFSRGDAAPQFVELGMCAPEAGVGSVHEHQVVLMPPTLPAGEYQVTAAFLDEAQILWGNQEKSILKSVPLGVIAHRK